MVKTGYNASWNTEANTYMCHIILCFEVIFVCHIPAVWHAKKIWSNHGLMRCVSTVLLFFHWKSVGLWNTKQSPPLLCCISDLTAAIHCSCFTTWICVFYVLTSGCLCSMLLVFIVSPMCMPFIHLLHN